MSKSTGNFMTLRECMNQFGIDASRLALGDSGDTMDDANFDSTVANANYETICFRRMDLKILPYRYWLCCY